MSVTYRFLGGTVTNTETGATTQFTWTAADVLGARQIVHAAIADFLTNPAGFSAALHELRCGIDDAIDLLDPIDP